MNARNCPECGDPLGAGKRSCPCGWSARQGGHRQYDNRCTWEAYGRRCPLPWSLHFGGKKTCRWHDGCESVSAGLSVIDDIERNGPPVQRDWRDEMIDRRIDDLGLRKHPDELRQPFIGRCRNEYREQVKRFLDRPGQVRRSKRQDDEENRTMAFLEHIARLMADGKSEDEARQIAMAEAKGAV